MHHRNALRMVLAFTTVFCLAIREASADGICKAAALRDVPALGVANSFIRKGGKNEAITQFRVDRRTGRTSYCSHGGGCYPTRIQVGDDLLLVLRMTSCKPSAKAYADEGLEPNEVAYALDVLHSRIPRAQMRREDVRNKLPAIGLCSACPDNAAQYYTVQPSSRCGALAHSALGGNPEAARKLQEDPAYCTWHYPKQSPPEVQAWF